MDETKDVSQMSDAELQALIAQDESAPAAEPEAPAEEAAPPAEAVPEATQKERQHVPLAELLEERGRRKEMQARLEEMETRFADFQRRTQEYLQQQVQPQPEPEPPPFEADPLEHLRQQQERLNQTLAMTQRQLAERELAQRQAAQWHAMREGVNQAEQAFVKSKPDYYDAVNFLRDQRTAQYQQAGVPEAQIPALLQRDAVTLAQTAASLGRSPAQFAYETALGLNYRAPAPAPAAEEVAQKAAAAPKSLGGTAGRGDAARPDLSDISRMSDKEFNAMFDKMMLGT
jgi:hypothetical protein